MTEKFLEEISVLAAKNQKAQGSLGRLERQGTMKFLCGLLSKIIQDENIFIQNGNLFWLPHRNLPFRKEPRKDQTTDSMIEYFKEGLNELVHLIRKQLL